jgi:uncharacterized membrane protein YeaQ/YmgE (transglycosylase-associated protein family)
MNAGTVLILVVAGLLAIILGWLVPALFKSRRPWGVLGDILVCTVATLVLSYVERTWLLPALGFSSQGWIAVAAAIGDPLGLGLVCLWLMRKIMPQSSASAQ